MDKLNSMIEDILQTVLSIEPEHLPSFFYSIINSATQNENNELAKLYSELFLKLCPEEGLAWYYAANSSFLDGDADTAVERLRQAILINPLNHNAHGDLIMISHYSDKITSEETLAYARDYYEKCVKPFKEKYFIEYDFSKHLTTYQKNEIIKIGFVSGDLRMHPVFFWVSSLFKNISKENLEIYCYVNNPKNEFSESLKQYSVSLNYIRNSSDKELAEKIYHDGIHILVDLSGHTVLNRLGTFSLKPAPLQITWLGQAGPLGLPEIDYMLADSFLVKKGEENLFTEKIYRLPNLFAPYPAKDYENLVINISFARDDGIIVLGSINNNIKINDKTLTTWAQILELSPNTVLLFKNLQTDLASYQNRILNIFKQNNIDETRIIFEPSSPKNEYLNVFNRIDIALDPFPVGGGTTTHETLMMSVPLISLCGNRLAHRGSASILQITGLGELVANNESEYISKVINLIHSPNLILQYKSTIRDKYLNSPANDTVNFAQDFLVALKVLWQRILSERTFEIGTLK